MTMTKALPGVPALLPPGAQPRESVARAAP
jgi:hypothetical protein